MYVCFKFENHSGNLDWELFVSKFSRPKSQHIVISLLDVPLSERPWFNVDGVMQESPIKIKKIYAH